jgi:hypothetical protein
VAQQPGGQRAHPVFVWGQWSARLSDTLKKASFPRRRESRVLILLVFTFGKHGFSESISVSLDE